MEDALTGCCVRMLTGSAQPPRSNPATSIRMCSDEHTLDPANNHQPLFCYCRMVAHYPMFHPGQLKVARSTGQHKLTSRLDNAGLKLVGRHMLARVYVIGSYCALTRIEKVRLRRACSPMSNMINSSQ
jgi:hypothetical protein